MAYDIQFPFFVGLSNRLAKATIIVSNNDKHKTHLYALVFMQFNLENAKVRPT